MLETLYKIQTVWKSYVAYRMAPTPITLSDRGGHFSGLRPF